MNVRNHDATSGWRVGSTSRHQPKSQAHQTRQSLAEVNGVETHDHSLDAESVASWQGCVMTGAQLALTSGALISLGLVLAVWRLVPATPDLHDVVDRLSTQHGRRQRVAAGAPATSGKERLGLWAMRYLPAGVWGTLPTRELALLRVSPPRFYGEKITFALLGLALPGLRSA